MVGSSLHPPGPRPPARSGWVTLGFVLVLGALPGCADRVEFEAGAACTLTTDCDYPLVCRLDRCRIECSTSRDCAPGLTCVKDGNGLGVCQVPEDTNCLRNSDCADPLICSEQGCVNACDLDSACPSGQDCVPSDGGVYWCSEPFLEECLRNSDCPAPLVCAVDRVCRVECRTDRDCSDGKICGTVLSTAACVVPVDGGP